MRFEHGRRGILDFGGGHVAGGLACGFGQFEEIELRIAIHVDVHGVVVRLGAGGPRRTGRGGIGDRGDLAWVRIDCETAVVVLADGAVLAAVAQRERGVLAGACLGIAERTRLAYRVETLEVTVGALEVVACDGDFGVAHAIAKEEDDVLGLLIADRGDALRAAMLGEFGYGFAVGTVGTVHGVCRRRHRTERCNGCECCDSALERLVLVHMFFFLPHGTFPRCVLDLAMPTHTLCRAEVREETRRRNPSEP